MSICAGTPITAPKGFGHLAAGVTYYFLRSSPTTRIVTLVEFVTRESKTVIKPGAKRVKRTVRPLPRPILVRLMRVDWEAGLLSGKVVAGERHPMPPWLKSLDGMDLAAIDGERKKAKKSHRDRVDEKLFAIHALLPRFEALLDEEQIEMIINRHARSLSPRQNETRVRLWLFTYAAFGRDRNSLHYPVHRIGHWNRMQEPVATQAKRGAPGAKGAEHGYNTTPEMLQKILDSYARNAGIGVTDEQVYIDAMRGEFGCRSKWVTRGGQKSLELFHPKGAPFPLKGTYFYHVNRKFRPHLVQATRRGKSRARSKLMPYRGTFTEAAWNLMQRSESDGYRVADLPKGYVEGSDLPPLVGVTKRDTASGKITGIGFEQGSETGAAYRRASFCEAIGFAEYGRLHGLKVKDSGKGVSPHTITDRGPGATSGGLPSNACLLPVIREITQAYSGQAKALVETSNPKAASDDEAPSFRRSNMTSIELVRREIAKALLFNEATNVASRVDPELEYLVTRLSPNGIWEALDSVGRNDAVQVGFDQAVRTFLDLTPAVLTRGGVSIAGRNYYSKFDAFQEALSSVSDGQDVAIKVYVLNSCTRHVWLDWNNRLIELDVRYPIAVSSIVKHMSMVDAVEYHEHMKRREADHQNHRRGARAQFAEDFEEQTGMKLESGTRVTGRAKRAGPTARQEAKEAKQTAAGRKAA